MVIEVLGGALLGKMLSRQKKIKKATDTREKRYAVFV